MNEALKISIHKNVVWMRTIIAFSLYGNPGYDKSGMNLKVTDESLKDRKSLLSWIK